MALQSSGAISINDIRTELGETTGSLRSLSATAGFSSPDAISEFYGYSGVTAPSVTTSAASSVGVSSATLNGNVTSDGGGTVTARGFYFGTNSNVTSNPTYGSGSGTGTFSLNRTGLSSSTTYYFAAYATNSAGTTVGSTLNLTTQTPVTLVATGSTFQLYTEGPRVWGNAYYPFNSGSIYTSPYPTGNVNGYFKTITYHQTNHPNYGWQTNYSLTNIHGTNASGTNISTGSTSSQASGNLRHKTASGYNVQNRFYMSGQHEEHLTSGNSQHGNFGRVSYDSAANYAGTNPAIISSSGLIKSSNTGSQYGTMFGDWNSSPSFPGAREGSYWTRTYSSSSYFDINRTSYSYFLVTV